MGSKTFQTNSWTKSSSVSTADLYQLDNGSQVVGVRYGEPATAANTANISYANQPNPPTSYSGSSDWYREEAWRFDALGNREWMTVREND